MAKPWWQSPAGWLLLVLGAAIMLIYIGQNSTFAFFGAVCVILGATLAFDARKKRG